MKNVTEEEKEQKQKRGSDEWKNIEIKGSFEMCIFVCYIQMFWTSFPFVQLNFSESQMANGLFNGSKTQRENIVVFFVAQNKPEILYGA